MKITEMLISAILKKGLFSDFKDINIDVDLPNSTQKVHIKIGSMSITLMQDEESKLETELQHF